MGLAPGAASWRYDSVLLTLIPIYVSCVCYVAAVHGLLTGGRFVKLWWSTGLLFYLLHVAAAFTFHHHWSHQAAYEETARQTRELFGMGSGSGLYFNYVFTLIWLADVAWMWKADTPARYWNGRPRWVSAAVHGFLAFLFFNATVVFGHGLTRWAGAAATIALGLTAQRTRRR